jgi:type I restriction-modification system DNA methylase subunit
MKIRGFVLLFFLFTLFFSITFSNEEEIISEVQDSIEVESELNLEGQILGTQEEIIEPQNISLQVKYAFQNATDLVERNIDF